MRFFVCISGLSLAASAARAADWPQPGGNPQHTNYTPDSPAPPYTMAWAVDFLPEFLWNAQPVISDGRVFLPTLHGHLYAFDEQTGSRLWHFKAGECIYGGAAAGDGKCGGKGLVFVASWEGVVHALDAVTGKPIWNYDTEEPISGTPCLAENTIFIGTRAGTLLALTMDGKLKWRQTLSWNMYNTAAYNHGRVFAVTEDMRAHCLDAKTGKVVWDSQKFYGLAIRDFYPVIHGGKLLFTVTPAVWNGGNGAVFPWSRPWDADALFLKLARDTGVKTKSGPQYASLLRGNTPPPEFEKLQTDLIAAYEAQPAFQSLFVLDEATGVQSYKAVHFLAGAGLEGVTMPPAACGDSEAVVLFTLGPGSNPGRLDLARNRMTDVFVEVGREPMDNHVYVSVGGNRVFFNFGFGQSHVTILDLATGEKTGLAGDSRLKPAKASVVPFRWRMSRSLSALRLLGTESSGYCPLSISGNRLYTTKKHTLTAWEGAKVK